MVIKDSNISKRLREGLIPIEELEYWLINNCTVAQLAHELADCLIEQQASKPINISMDEFMTHFRIKGTKWVNGQMVADGRGSMRWAGKDSD